MQLKFEPSECIQKGYVAIAKNHFTHELIRKSHESGRKTIFSQNQ